MSLRVRENAVQGNYGGPDDCAGELMADAAELFRRYWNERLGGEGEE